MRDLSPTLSKQLSAPKTAPRARALNSSQVVGFDSADLVSLASIDPAVLDDITSLKEAATEICFEGPRGQAMRRALSREFQISRASLRYREMIANLVLDKFSRGLTDRKTVEVMEKALAVATKRFYTVTDKLERIESTPHIHINSDVTKIRVEATR